MTPLLIIPIDGKPWAMAVDRPTRIGRADDCTLCLNSRLISRHHAAITWDGTHLWIDDLGSRNGTFVNGKRTTSPTALNDRDELRLGDVILKFRLVRDIPRSAEPHHGTGREHGLIVFRCPNCAHRIGADAAMVHFVRTCPGCEQPVIVASPEAEDTLTTEGKSGVDASGAPSAPPVSKPAVRTASAAQEKPKAAPPDSRPRGEAAPAAAPLQPAPIIGCHLEASDAPCHIADPTSAHLDEAPALYSASLAAPHVKSQPDAASAANIACPGFVNEAPGHARRELANATAQDQTASPIAQTFNAQAAAPTPTENALGRDAAEDEASSHAEAPAPVVERTFAETTADHDAADRCPAPIQSDTVAQRVNAAHGPAGLYQGEPVLCILWGAATTASDMPGPSCAAQPTKPLNHVAQLPWSAVLERPGMHMDHHPSAAPVCAEIHPHAVNTVMDAPHLDEHDWFAAPINQPWQITKKSGDGLPGGGY